MKKQACILILFALILALFTACGSKEKADGASAVPQPAEIRWQDYNGKRIGVLTGTLMEAAADAYFPDSEHLLFNSYPDMNAALLANKIDAYLGDEPNLKTIHFEQPRIDYIRERITNQNYSFAFRKNDPASAALCEELNAYLARCRADGTLQEIDDIWMGIDEDKKVVDMSDLTGENGTIRVITTSTDMPWSYIKDRKNVGYDIDLVVRFCRDRGYALELGDVDFSGRIPAIQSGKYDFTTDMNVTPERAQEVLFSDPTSSGGIVLAVQSSVLTQSAQGEKDAQGTINSFSDLKNARIGVHSDLMEMKMLQRDFPDAQVLAYNDYPLAYQDVANGRLDAYVYARREMELAIEHGTKGVRLLDETYCTDTIAVGLSPVTPVSGLREKLNAFIAEKKADGTLDDMYERWVVRLDETMPDIAAPAHPTAHLRVGTTGTVMPYSYFVGTELNGYDIELAYRFAAWLGADVEFKVYDFGGIISAAAVGDVDCIMSNLYYTPEKAEMIPFSDPLYDVEITAMVREDAAAGSDGGFWASVKASFEKTFLRENRWMLFVQGIGTTLLITALSILFGTALGFAVFLLCRNGNRAANSITRFFVWLINGMPMVVLLMILYYIVFGKVAISGTAVSVIGFTLVFGAAMYGMLKSGVGAVDKGQAEAAYSLGYTDRRAFFRVVLPQALPHFMPAYKGQITALIKATAIVGYVAVQDLTKMGDIVRSRTYEAFFPLIAVAVVYFILAAILTFLVNRIELRIDPKKRKRAAILKGVKAE